MRRTRFWVGTALLLGPCMMAAIVANAANVFTSSGRVDGHISYHGCPLTGGMIMFLPGAREDSDWVSVHIGKDGRFSIPPSWHRAAKASRYRICVIPDRRQFALDPPPRHGAPGQLPNKGVGGTRGHIIPISHASRPRFAPHPDPVPPNLPKFPLRFTNPLESGLSVELSRDPASLEIDIRD